MGGGHSAHARRRACLRRDSPEDAAGRGPPAGLLLCLLRLLPPPFGRQASRQAGHLLPGAPLQLRASRAGVTRQASRQSVPSSAAASPVLSARPVAARRRAGPGGRAGRGCGADSWLAWLVTPARGCAKLSAPRLPRPSCSLSLRVSCSRPAAEEPVRQATLGPLCTVGHPSPWGRFQGWCVLGLPPGPSPALCPGSLDHKGTSWPWPRLSAHPLLASGADL